MLRQNPGRKTTKQTAIEALQRAGAEIPGFAEKHVFEQMESYEKWRQQQDAPPLQEIMNEFQSWHRALKAAGYDVKVPRKRKADTTYIVLADKKKARFIDEDGKWASIYEAKRFVTEFDAASFVHDFMQIEDWPPFWEEAELSLVKPSYSPMSPLSEVMRKYF